MPILRFLTPLLDRLTSRSEPQVDLRHTAYIASRTSQPARQAPVLPEFPAFYKLVDCRILAETGKAQLFVGRDPQGLQKVIKFYRFAQGLEEDSPRTEELSNALQVSFTNSFFLSVDRVCSICQHPQDPASYGFAYQMPFCRYGSLADHTVHGFSSQSEIVAVALASLIPLLLLKDQGLAHGDVKPTNIMYWAGENASSSSTPDGIRLVLADFGSSIDLKRDISKDRSLRQGTPRYCAPEAFAGAPPSHADDMWAWATTVIEMFLPAAVCRERLTAGYAISLDDVPDQTMPAWLGSALGDCRRQEPGDRPAANDVLAAFMTHWDVIGDKASGPRTPGKSVLLNTLIRNELNFRGTKDTQIRVTLGIDADIATATQLLEANKDSGARQAVVLLQKALVHDGAERCLLDQFLDDMWMPAYERVAPEPEHRLYLPVPNFSLRKGMRLYLTALIETVQSDFDSAILDSLEELAVRLHHLRWSMEFQDIGPDLVEALVIVNRPDLATDALGQFDDDQNRAVPSMRARSHVFMAQGSYVNAVNHSCIALRLSDGEVEVREIIFYAILVAACGGTLGTLSAGVEEMLQSEAYKAASRTLQMHLVVAYLAPTEGLTAMREYAQQLKSGAFLSGSTSIAEIWLVCACLVRLEEREFASRIATAALNDPRSLLGTHKVYRDALESIAVGGAPTVQVGSSEGVALESARAATRSANLELTLEELLNLLDRDDLTAATLVEVAQEASSLFDSQGMHEEELQVYAQLFSTLERSSCAGVERAAMQLAVNELATMKQLERWSELLALATQRSRFFSKFTSQSIGPEAARFEWYLCHALDVMGRHVDVVTQCDRVIEVCRQWELDDTRTILELALRYKGATLSQMGRDQEEAEVYMHYFDLVPHDPSDADGVSSRVEVRQFLVLLLLRLGKRQDTLAHIAAAQDEYSSATVGLTESAVSAMSTMLKFQVALRREMSDL